MFGERYSGLVSEVQRIIHVPRVVASRAKHDAGAVLLRPLVQASLTS